MKTIVPLFVLLVYSTSVSARTEPDKPDKFVTHCAVMYFLEQLEMVDTLVYKTIEKGILEGQAVYNGQTGYLCYELSVSSDGMNTNISVILLEKEIEYMRSSFNFHKGKLDSALLDVFLDNNESYSHFYLKRNKKLSWQRGSDGVSKEFSGALFEEHLLKVTPL